MRIYLKAGLQWNPKPLLQLTDPNKIAVGLYYFNIFNLNAFSLGFVGFQIFPETHIKMTVFSCVAQSLTFRRNLFSPSSGAV